MDRYGEYEWLLGMSLEAQPLQCHQLVDLKTAIAQHPQAWWMGAFSYDWKNALEPGLHTRNPAAIPFPELCFFKADVVIYQKRGSELLTFACGYSPDLLAAIQKSELPPPSLENFSAFQSQFSREEYIQAVSSVREYIRQGDTYELNLSQNFVAHTTLHHPAALWERLIQLSPAPFAAYARWGDRHLMSASPERFLRHDQGILITQPIKGTAPRHPDPQADAQAAQALSESIKEQAENVMIVDLSRNDLHRSCLTGSVRVPHLFEVQAFPQVHHLVSTIMGQKRPDIHALDALAMAFPPGSMTGAPKVRTCQLIDEIERSARGLYAGSVGYIAPDGNFDLNVIIRSLVYNAQTACLSYHVGGAITWDSDPVAEYEETLIKARGLRSLFEEI